MSEAEPLSPVADVGGPQQPMLAVSGLSKHFAVGSGLGIMAPPMRTLAFLTLREWHFKAPVFIGDTVRPRSKILKKEDRGRGRRGVITWQRQIVNQEGTVVQEGITETLVEGRAAISNPE